MLKYFISFFLNFLGFGLIQILLYGRWKIYEINIQLMLLFFGDPLMSKVLQNIHYTVLQIIYLMHWSICLITYVKFSAESDFEVKMVKSRSQNGQK